ncbi:STAS domain-containing protein [Carboxydothermus pertinax]|uniref:STAS domain-containing protein n=1 Tax=Carboxydothermus pertinax TaxID=870242 RepID=A0A1L8CTK6_9THEO|nr:STAS domain-containing protein [Carboxydothermus pertinax]GAV22248.1 hypothetical protein cpu_07580 [Carboxydothermus pertinax]
MLNSLILQNKDVVVEIYQATGKNIFTSDEVKEILDYIVGVEEKKLAEEVFSEKLYQKFRQREVDYNIFYEELYKIKKAVDELILKQQGEVVNLLLENEKYFHELYAVFNNKFVKVQKEIIKNQMHSIQELSTPVVEIWDKILALPIIGTLDSYRVRTMMEQLLEKIQEVKAKIVIIDITGVAVVDTETANYLIKTAKAAGLMGCEVIITGIRPQIAQTIVQLGIFFDHFITKDTLKAGLEVAFKKLNLEVK